MEWDDAFLYEDGLGQTVGSHDEQGTEQEADERARATLTNGWTGAKPETGEDDEDENAEAVEGQDEDRFFCGGERVEPDSDDGEEVCGDRFDFEAERTNFDPDVPIGFRQVGWRIRIPTDFPSIEEAVESLGEREQFDESFVQCVTIYLETAEVSACEMS